MGKGDRSQKMKNKDRQRKKKARDRKRRTQKLGPSQKPRQSWMW